MEKLTTITITVDAQTINRIDAIKALGNKKNRSYATRRLVGWGFSYYMQSNCGGLFPDPPNKSKGESNHEN